MTSRWLTAHLPFPQVTEEGAIGELQGKGILWIDFADTAERERLAQELEALKLVDLERPMLGHVFEGVGPDAYGANRVSGYDEQVAARLATGTPVTFLHAFALAAEIGIAPAADEDLPRVYRQDVHFLVGSRWILTSRKRGHAATRGYTFPGDAVTYNDLLRFIERHWAGTNEPADAAILLLRALVDTYPHAIADVAGRLQNSELGYMRGIDEPQGSGNLDDREYRQELVDVKWIVDGLSNSINDLRRPGVDAGVSWFRVTHASAAAREVETLLRDARDELGRLREQLRQSFDLIASTQSSRQIELGRREQRHRQRLEQVVTVVTATLLVPGLVAASIEALPTAFEHDLHTRLALLLSLMVGLGIVSYAVLTILRARGDTDEQVGIQAGHTETAKELAHVERLALASVFNWPRGGRGCLRARSRA
jgi:hypothetical protein